MRWVICKLMLEFMKKFITKYSAHPRVLSILGGIVVITAVLTSSFFVAGANDGRVLTIYDQGEEQTIVTKEQTIGKALEQAEVQLDELDNVEPARETELIADNYKVNVYRARPVMIIDGSKRTRVMTSHQSPQQIAKQANITLYDEDKAELKRVDDTLADGGAGLKMEIKRATPFTLVFYGKESVARTHAKTVAGILKEKNIKLGKKDGMSLPSNTPVKQGMKLEIWRNGKQTITQEEDIAFPIEQVQDMDREVGYKEIKTPGEAGKKTVTYEVEMRNGKEISRKEIKSIVTKQPKKQVVIVGGKASFNGGFAEALAQLRACEGSYTSNTGNGYYGAYQFDIGTWGGYGGYPHAAAAPPSVQDQKAWETYQRRGWSPWPSCGASLPDIFR